MIQMLGIFCPVLVTLRSGGDERLAQGGAHAGPQDSTTAFRNPAVLKQHDPKTKKGRHQAGLLQEWVL